MSRENVEVVRLMVEAARRALRNGRVVRHAGYPDASEALQAVGLSE